MRRAMPSTEMLLADFDLFNDAVDTMMDGGRSDDGRRAFETGGFGRPRKRFVASSVPAREALTLEQLAAEARWSLRG